MSIKIVIDTSVFISALLGPAGPSRELIRRCLLSEYHPLMGSALFSEYEAVLTRRHLIERCLLSEAEIAILVQSFMSISKWTFIYYTWRPNLKDEGDNHLIELAIAGNAQMIATNNLRDFRDAELLFPNLKILKPENILERS